ncbi:MAG: conjugal transfer mating pair stabilization protein TraN [Candidatus Midichloriaceae bacterium]|jgi:conjugal transfer mating pair stabilization protein TraN|nr:conjugal transfer mating pair stabilization protein TraN [Candidatus Midichloriaceae bacterium]
MKQIIIILVFLFTNYAYGCIKVSENCLDGPSTKVIDGKSVYRECWKYEDKYDCISSEYKDYCQGIRQVAGCEQVDSKCIQQDEDGKCLEYRDTFRCGNLLKNQVAETKFLNSEYTITRDELTTQECPNTDNCHELESVCVEGPETRNINGKDVHKDCWKYAKKYACFVGSIISDCTEYESKCVLKKELCLSQTSTGECRHKEKQYECLNVNAPVTLSCITAKYCIGENCQESTYTANNNFGQAISALSILTSIKKDFMEEECKHGANNCRVFKGDKHACKINPVGSRNCCKDKGWANDIKLTECTEGEKLLAKKKENDLCHAVGTYCSKKVLGFCLETKRSYCCFNSKLARIIHEQGRAQLGIGWGNAKSPNCQPLTLEQIQKIDFSKVDLREIYQDVTSKINLNNHAKLPEEAAIQLKEKLGETVEYKEEIARRLKEHYGQ